MEADRCGRAGNTRIVQARCAQHAVNRRPLEQACRRPHQAIRRFDAVLLEQADRTRRREVTSFLVGGPDLERGDDLGVPLHRGHGQRAGRAVVGAPHRFRPGQFAQRSIDRPDRDAICLGCARDHLGPGRIARRQQRQAPAQVDQCLTRGALRAVSHASRSRRRRHACPRDGTGWPPTRPCAWPRRAPAASLPSSGHAPR